MQKLSIFAIVVLLYIPTYCQQLTKTNRYQVPIVKEPETQLVFKMSFGKYDILSIEGDTSLLKNAGDIMIDVVCTDYPANISLTQLNQRRVEAFFNVFKYIDKSQMAVCNVYRQTDGINRTVSDTMFHGLVVRYRPKQTAETMKKDVSELDKIVELDTVGNENEPKFHPADSVPIKKTVQKPTWQYITVYKKQSKILTRTMVEEGYEDEVYGGNLRRVITSDTASTYTIKNYFIKLDSTILISPRKAFRKDLIDKELHKDLKRFSKIRISYGIPLDTAIAETPTCFNIDSIAKTTTNPSGKYSSKYQLEDSTIFKILTRNHWKNTNVVGDVTGSMYPYTGQLLLWLKLNALDSLTKNYTFFNDGDDMPDRKKKIGNTGGIYSKECHTFEQVKELAKSTMVKGGGGDCAENDVEALLASEEAFPNIDYQILIADNWAPIKDKKLIKKLTKPIRIVLCGTINSMVNVDYLNLARKTNGSLHLIEEDISNLATLHEGQMIQIGNYKYKIVKDDFVLVNEL